jgi:hypothetical protein
MQFGDRREVGMRIRPFRESDTFDTFRNIIDRVTGEIQSLENAYVLKASPTELENYYVERVLIHPLVLHTNQYYIEGQEGTKIDVTHDFRRAVFPGERAEVQGTRLDIAIPYEGDPLLWRIRASTFSLSGHPEIEVRDNVIVFTVSFPDDSADPVQLKAEIESEIESLTDAVRNLGRDVENHNKSAPGVVKSALQRKRQLAESTIGAVTALGIPMKRRGEPLTFTAPLKRRPSPLGRPRVTTEPFKPEPVLEEEEYQYILNVMRSMSLVIERSPEAFATLDEEDIRTHFLLQLNGHYEGNATGETFNASGKTDILIRGDNRNIFIAECKFWRGPREFNEAVDQLLGYMTWRDSKCALLIFNKTKNSSAVREKMHEVMQGRQEHRRTVAHAPEGDSRYILVKDSDPGSEIIVTTQLYDIPTKSK